MTKKETPKIDVKKMMEKLYSDEKILDVLKRLAKK